MVHYKCIDLCLGEENDSAFIGGFVVFPDIHMFFLSQTDIFTILPTPHERSISPSLRFSQRDMNNWRLNENTVKLLK